MTRARRVARASRIERERQQVGEQGYRAVRVTDDDELTVRRRC